MLASAYVEKFGGDCLGDMQEALRLYGERWRRGACGATPSPVRLLGSGKTASGTACATCSGTISSSGLEVTRRLGKSVEEVFSQDGEEAFARPKWAC